MQNCWAVQDCRMHFISQMHTLDLGPDTRTPGLARTRCPSEITGFSYLVWFTDQARKVLIFCKQVIGAPFPYRMLSDRHAQQETAGAMLSPGSPQLSAVTFQLGWLKDMAVHPIDLSEIILFVCLFCVWPFVFSSRIKGWNMAHPTKCSLTCAIRTACEESAVADVPAEVRGAHLAHSLSLLWENW